MLLAYTVSNIYQRHKARSRKAKLDDSEVVGHDETLLFIVVALYAASVLTLALTLMGGGIMCRPISIQLGNSPWVNRDSASAATSSTAWTSSTACARPR